MFSIPSTECEIPQEELKELNNLSLTNVSSESDPASSPSCKKEGNKIDWLSVADSVLGWFQAKMVAAGDLETLIHEQRTKQKKYKAERLLQEEALQLDSIFNRRLSRRLTISI